MWTIWLQYRRHFFLITDLFCVKTFTAIMTRKCRFIDRTWCSSIIHAIPNDLHHCNYYKLMAFKSLSLVRWQRDLLSEKTATMTAASPSSRTAVLNGDVIEIVFTQSLNCFWSFCFIESQASSLQVSHDLARVAPAKLVTRLALLYDCRACTANWKSASSNRHSCNESISYFPKPFDDSILRFSFVMPLRRSTIWYSS